MKKIFLLLITMLIIIASCSKTAKIQVAAETAMNQLFKEVARVPESVIVDNIEVKYVDDSLCILNANFTAKNGLGQESTTKYEYVYLVSMDQAYETYEEEGIDDVYLEPEEFEKEKHGKIYEALCYEEALRYLASIKVMQAGRAVGDKERNDVNIPMVLETGLWEKKQYKDAFNEETDDSYLLLQTNGAFTNSATSGSELTVLLFVDDDIFLRLAEYSSMLVKGDDSYSLIAKGDDGIVHHYRLYNDYDGNMSFSSFFGEGEDSFRELLEKGGIITCVMKEITEYGIPSQYYFKFNVTGYNEAIKSIQ